MPKIAEIEYTPNPNAVKFVLRQPVASLGGQGMATVQVAETLELRQTLARHILLDTLWRQAALLALIAAVVVWVVQRATRPVRQLGAAHQRCCRAFRQLEQTPGLF